MPLTNQQFDQLQREYEARRNRHLREMQEKLDRAYDAYPRLAGIDEEVVDLNMIRARAKLGIGQERDVEQELADLSLERCALLAAAGFPDGVAEPEYDCPICRDTGMVDGRKCNCFLKAETDLLCSVSGLNDILKKESFGSFRLDCYSERIKDPDNGRSAREAARLALEHSRRFVEQFREEYTNLYFYGKTGVGKTFLSHCIAGALIEKGVNVCYLSESSLIELFEESRFRTTDESRAGVRLALDCDLLVIDDLGSNPNNSFISSVLLRCIEERHLAKRSTVITTNLSLEDLQDRYSDRIFSRIYSYYKIIYLLGDDIRIKL